MSYDDPCPLFSSRLPLYNAVAAGQSAPSDQTTTTRSQMDSSKAPTEQPPTASHQIPSPHNHKLTAESEGERETGEEDKRQKSGGQIVTVQTWRTGRKRYKWETSAKFEEVFFSPSIYISFSPSLIF